MALIYSMTLIYSRAFIHYSFLLSKATQIMNNFPLNHVWIHDKYYNGGRILKDFCNWIKSL